MSDLIDELILNSPTPIPFSGHSVLMETTIEDWFKDGQQWLKAISLVK